MKRRYFLSGISSIALLIAGPAKSGSMALLGAGAAPSPSVTSLPQQANLVTKFSADSITGLSNGANLLTSSWVDSQNSIAADVILGTAPTFQTGVVGGKPSVRFGGAGNLKITTPGALKTAVDTQTYTVLIAAKTIGSSGIDYGVFSASAGGNSFLFFSDGAALTGRYNASTAFAAKMPGTSFFTFGSISNPAAAVSLSVELSMFNGTSYHTTNSLAPGSGGNAFEIGGWNNGGFHYNGDVFEILVWNIALTPAQYMQAQKWVSEKYAQTYPWAAVSKMPVFFGDSLTSGETTTDLSFTPSYGAAQTNLGFTYGQYQSLGIPGLTMDGMTTLAPAFVNPIAAMAGKTIGVMCWEWANQRDSTTTKGALMLAALKATANVQTCFGTSTSASQYDNSAPRASYDAAWDAIWAGAKTDIDSYMAIHLDSHIGVDGSYATFSSGGDGLHLTNTTYPYLAALFSTGFSALP